MKNLQQFIFEEPKEMCSLKTVHRLLSEYMDSFNIYSIPLDVRKRAVRDYDKICEEFRIASWEYLANIEPVIEESLESDIENTEYVIETFKYKYKMEDYQFMAVHPYEVRIVAIDKIPNYIAASHTILFPDVKKNIEIIKVEMKSIGYYMVRKKQYYDRDQNIEWTMMVFDPIRQEDISTQIRSRCSILYHFSPIVNHQSIIENGIIPQNEGRLHTYNEDRVYLVAMDPKHEEFEKMLKTVSKNLKRIDNSFDGMFIIYEIRLSKLPLSMKFFYDPHGKNCTYTTEHIPYSAITYTQEIKV